MAGNQPTVQSQIDAAEAALRQTTSTYPAMRKRYGPDESKWPPASEWAVAFAQLEAAKATAAPPAPPPTPPPTSGLRAAYVGSTSPDGLDAFAAWVPTKFDLASSYCATDTWSNISGPSWLLQPWKGRYRLALAVPMLPASGGALAAGATGAYNAYFATLAGNLAAAGQGDAILRLGWEFNGGWYAWKVTSQTDAANFALYWRQIVATMRTIAPGLLFDWCPSLGIWPQGWTLEQAYPGDVYVDYIGLDVYDQSWVANYADFSTRWASYLNGQPNGLQWHRDFAAAHNKPVSFPEWGVTIRSDGHGGGDCPQFVQAMHDWFASSTLGYQSYFEFDAPDGAHSLQGGKFPQSAAKFQALFGGTK